MDDVIFMDAEIRPHRALSERGMITLVIIVTALNGASAAVFVAKGAYWACAILALDLVAILAALIAVYAAAGRIERVKVTDRAVSVTREGGRWTKLIWESPTAFTRVDLTTEDHRAIDLQLALSAERATVAGGLSPSERAVFAHALEQAIGAARRARG